MSGHKLLGFVLGWCVTVTAIVEVQPALAATAQVDPRAEVAAALYAASATQAAAERVADAKLRAQRQEIETLRAAVRSGEAQRQADLTAAEENYVAALAARDRAYAQEIAVFRKAVEDIAATPEGAAALARFNAGDELGALAVLDELRAARDAARKKRADIESAAEGRRIATLALEARTRGKLTTAEVIQRYEAITRLDPGVHWDWVELGGLYKAAGNLAAAMKAAQAATNTAVDDRDRSVAFSEIGDVLVAQGDLPGALAAYRKGLAIRETLAARDPGNTGWQRDLIVSYVKLSEVTGDRSYATKALTIAQTMQQRGTLQPRDAWMVDELKRRSGQ